MTVDFQILLIHTLFQTIRGHKIFHSGKNTRYLGVAMWNFNKSQYTVLDQAGTPVLIPEIFSILSRPKKNLMSKVCFNLL